MTALKEIVMGRQMKRRIRRGKESGAEYHPVSGAVLNTSRCGFGEPPRASGGDAWPKATVKYISKKALRNEENVTGSLDNKQFFGQG
jgi:hypothetical protein